MEISQKDIKSRFEQKFIHFPSDIIKKQQQQNLSF